MAVKAFTAKQAQRLDRIATERIGIPSIILMENAGRITAFEIMCKLKTPKGHFICIVCGPGNNGGDGFVAARHLHASGYKIKVFLIGKASKLKKDSLINYRILRKLKCSIQEVGRVSPQVLKDFKRSSVIVDAIFGIGLNREVCGFFKAMIELINSLEKFVICVDVPSGLDATTGLILGSCIKGQMTVTFAVLKKGLIKKDGLKYSGRIKIADIGIPKQAESKA